MKSRTTAQFRDKLARLPADAQAQARAAYRHFQQNPRHPSLRFRQVQPNDPIYSARVGIYYRAVGALDGDTIVWFWVGPHSEYDALLSKPK